MNQKMNLKNKKLNVRHVEAKAKVSAQQKGITLIALVITIIVLLILAGVTINMVLGDDGIIERAKQSGETYQEKEDEEIIKLAYTAIRTDKLGNKIEEITVDGIKEELEKTYETGKIAVEKNGTNFRVKITEEDEDKIYSITANGEVTKLEIETFEFILNDVTYIAEKGMTWEEWVFSWYNTDYDNTKYAKRTYDGALHIFKDDECLLLEGCCYVDYEFYQFYGDTNIIDINFCTGGLEPDHEPEPFFIAEYTEDDVIIFEKD